MNHADLAEGYTFRDLGRLAEQRGDLRATVQHYTQAITHFQRVFNGYGLVPFLIDLGRVERARGNQATAAQHFEAARAATFAALDLMQNRQEQQETVLSITAWEQLARIAEAAGDDMEAVRCRAYAHDIRNQLFGRRSS